MAITMRMVARIFFFATEVTQGPLSSVHYTHIKHTPKSRCAIWRDCEDAIKMSSRSRGTCLGDLAGDHTHARRTHARTHALTLMLMAMCISVASVESVATMGRDHKL